jgi:Ca2+-binding RTX toxin-like protein
MANFTEAADAPNDSSTPYAISIGDSFTGLLEGTSDDDWIAIQIDDVGDSYVFTMTPTAPSLTQAVVQINTSAGIRVNSTTSSNSIPAETFWSEVPGREAGTYYISARSFSGFESGSYTITSLRETGQTDMTNGRLTTSGVVNGLIDFSGDADRYRSEFDANFSYTVIMTPTNPSIQNGAPIFNGIRQEGGSSSSGVSHFDDGISSATVFTETAGTYFTNVASGVSTAGVERGGYTLQLIREDLSNENSSLRMDVGTAFNGMIDFRNDRDAIGVQLVAGQTYDISVASSEAGQLNDLSLSIFSLETSFTFLNGSRSDADATQSTFVARSDGLAFLQVQNGSLGDRSAPNETGGFTLNVNIRGQDLSGTSGNNTLEGGAGNDTLRGLAGNDVLRGAEGSDSLFGGDGADTLNGGDGDDFIFGGDSSADLRDLVFAGAGNDSIDAGYGNDEVFGQDGNDTIAGGFGSDTLQGQNGNDVLTGSALSDLVFGNAGDDFVNGGFGHDRINGGTGADRFFHLGILDHGSDFIQDYNAAEGDRLLFGIAGATRSQFQININDAVAPDGEKAGDDNVQEAFVIYRPTGQIMWALIDGAGQSSINLQLGPDVFDLLA